jgi:hypothetical protein
MLSAAGRDLGEALVSLRAQHTPTALSAQKHVVHADAAHKPRRHAAQRCTEPRRARRRKPDLRLARRSEDPPLHPALPCTGTPATRRKSAPSATGNAIRRPGTPPQGSPDPRGPSYGAKVRNAPPPSTLPCAPPRPAHLSTAGQTRVATCATPPTFLAAAHMSAASPAHMRSPPSCCAAPGTPRPDAHPCHATRRPPGPKRHQSQHHATTAAPPLSPPTPAASYLMPCAEPR